MWSYISLWLTLKCPVLTPDYHYGRINSNEIYPDSHLHFDTGVSNLRSWDRFVSKNNWHVVLELHRNQKLGRNSSTQQSYGLPPSHCQGIILTKTTDENTVCKHQVTECFDQLRKITRNFVAVHYHYKESGEPVFVLERAYLGNYFNLL